MDLPSIGEQLWTPTALSEMLSIWRDYIGHVYSPGLGYMAIHVCMTIATCLLSDLCVNKGGGGGIC